MAQGRVRGHLRKQYILLACVSVLAVIVRYLGRDFDTSDLRVFRTWCKQMMDAGTGIESLRHYRGDYPMPYIFLLYLFGKLPMPLGYAIKLSNVPFDFLMAFAIGRIAEILKPRGGWSFCMGYGTALLLPNVFFNSCYWGQSDSLYVSLLMLSLLFYIREKYPLMILFFGMAVSVKLQSIFMLPFLLLAYWTRKRYSVLLFLIVPAVMLAFNIPAILAGYPPLYTFTQFLKQTGGFPYLYYFYPNLWFFFQARPYYMFGTGAVMLAAAALLLFVVTFIKRGCRLDGEAGVTVACWLAWTCVFFLPAMHERYGFLAEMLMLAAAVADKKYIPVAVPMYLCILPKYLFALGLMPNPLWLQAAETLLNTGVYLIFTGMLWRDLGFSEKQGAEEREAVC